MSVELKGKLTAKGNLNGKIGIGGVAGTDNYPDLNNLPQINGVTLIDNKTSEELGIIIPTKTSDLENDSGFITSDDLPTKVSDLENDTGFITSEDVPTKTSELDNDSGFVTIDDVINDAISSDNQAYSSDKVEELIDSLLPIDTSSGAVATFSTDLSKPLVSLKADITAVQASGTPTPSTPIPISGRSAVNIYQLGGNFFDKGSENLRVDFLINGAGNEVSYADWNISDYVPVVEAASYYLYGLSTHPNTQQDNFEFFDENKTRLGYVNVKTYDQPLTIPDGVKYVKFSVKNSDMNTAQFSVAQTNYEPYNPTTNTKVINLGDTYYGGYITQDKNGHQKLVVTHSDLTLLNSLNWYPTVKQSKTCFYANLPNGIIKTGGEQLYSGLCETYNVTNDFNMSTNNSVVFYCSSLYGGYTRVLIRDDSASTMTGAEFKEYVSGKILYPINTPIVIDLPDIEPFTTLIGTNNIFADSGDVEVKYKESIQKYIDDKIAETQALIL